jgi:hypothetical protein
MFAGKSAAESNRFETDHFSGVGAVILGRRMADLGIGPWGDEPTAASFRRLLGSEGGFRVYALMAGRQMRATRRGANSTGLAPLRLFLS